MSLKYRVAAGVPGRTFQKADAGRGLGFGLRADQTQGQTDVEHECSLLLAYSGKRQPRLRWRSVNLSRPAGENQAADPCTPLVALPKMERKRWPSLNGRIWNAPCNRLPESRLSPWPSTCRARRPSRNCIAGGPKSSRWSRRAAIRSARNCPELYRQLVGNQQVVRARSETTGRSRQAGHASGRRRSADYVDAAGLARAAGAGMGPICTRSFRGCARWRSSATRRPTRS